jgi:hypothetical protein
MTKEEKALRDQIRVAVPNPAMRRSVSLKIGALIKAVKEDCIEAYHDWEDRPGGHTNVVTFPEAIRKNMRWHLAAALGK